ncbi:water-specific aquaporin [Sarcoptes scabiei]|nr:water-specific aquaporin [Sarcoptes scabiei]
MDEDSNDHIDHINDHNHHIHPQLENNRLSIFQKISFSVGHVFNDLCAAFWFTYLLIYMHSVNGFSSRTAGTLMLIGQIADGLATPFVGIECDRNLDWFICNYGRRKCWHFIGTICVFFSFPFLFNHCFDCENSTENAQIVYYSAFIIIFQFGWASVQISHLSLIPDLTPVSSERIELNAYRYACTVFANITIYLMMLFVLDFNDKVHPNGSSQIGPSDDDTFRIVSFIVIIIGFVFSAIFHIGTREKPNRSVYEEDDSDAIVTKIRPMNWRNWFQQSQFYIVALLYMGTRLTINLTQVYVPNYLQETLRLPKKSIAYIPLVTYTSGFLSSFIMKYVNGKLGKKMTFFLGTIIAISSCVWIYFGNDTNFKSYGIFAVSILIGVSSSTMLITSLAITNDLIGKNTASGAFVFGAMSFVDKVSNGLAIMIIEYFKPCRSHSKIGCQYYRDILTFVCSGATVICIISLAMLSTQKIGRLTKRPIHDYQSRNPPDFFTNLTISTSPSRQSSSSSGRSSMIEDGQSSLLKPLLGESN